MTYCELTFWEVDIFAWEVDILGVDILGVDILRLTRNLQFIENEILSTSLKIRFIPGIGIV